MWRRAARDNRSMCRQGWGGWVGVCEGRGEGRREGGGEERETVANNANNANSEQAGKE